MPRPERRLAVAGLGIDVEGLSPAQLGFEGRLRPFVAAPGAVCHKVVKVRCRAGRPDVPDARLVYDPGGIWRLYRLGDRLYARIQYGDDTRPHADAVIEIEGGWDDVTLVERPEGDGWESLLAFGAGELLVRVNIIDIGGLVFHACGVDAGGRAVMFIGHSGAGKSTQARLWSAEPGVVVMNDDRVAVRAGAGGPIACGTPWGGDADIARNHDAPLAAIVVLEQASENAVIRLEPAAAAPQVAARAFMPYWDAALMQRALANLDTLLRTVPAYVLKCRPEREVIDLVRTVL